MPNYKHYGGRGIKICDRWLGLEGFTNFAQDMGEKPSAKHSINRIDNDGDYEPGNVRWATSKQQRNNQQIKNKNGANGIQCKVSKLGVMRWQVCIAMGGPNTLIGSFDSIEEAISARLGAESEYDYGI